MRDLYPQHGRRRRWFAPRRVICRCGLEAYPCAVVRMRRREIAEIREALDRHDDGVAAAREWQGDERRRWTGGAR